MDQGKLEEGLKLMEEAHKLDPDFLTYEYEIGYAYYSMKEYKKAIKTLEKLTRREDVVDNVFQLIGNSYDNLGEKEKARKAYEDGLEKFPNSGALYLEYGILELSLKQYDNAISRFEKGVEVEPKFSSNYYWLARLFCSSTEEVWGMIYGEIFLNLEPEGRRNSEISKLLYDKYKSEIKFTSDTSMTVSFSKNSSISLESLKDPSKMKLPYGMSVYEPGIMVSLINIKSINLTTLNTVRQNFVDNYFSGTTARDYPNSLFTYQKKVKDAGHMEAYNYWILRKGETVSFDSWQYSHKELWTNFMSWLEQNRYSPTAEDKFVRTQYN